MPEKATKRKYEFALPTNPQLKDIQNPATAFVRNVSPAQLERMNSRQRRELVNKLIAFLKSS